MSGSDRGAATVLALALVQVLLVTAMACAVVASLAITRMRVATAADVAALAAAQAMGEPCAAAASSAELNGTHLIACTIDGADIVVEVAADAPAIVVRGLALLGRPAPVVTRLARAGPP